MSVEIDVSEVVRMSGRLKALRVLVEQPHSFLRTLGEGVKMQTEQRIAHEKRGPDGRPWLPWSAAYAKTRTAADSLLIDTHDLLESIKHAETRDEAVIFSEIVYAGVHQFGHGPIPARPYLGISEENATDIERWLGDELLDVLRS